MEMLDPKLSKVGF